MALGAEVLVRVLLGFIPLLALIIGPIFAHKGAAARNAAGFMWAGAAILAVNQIIGIIWGLAMAPFVHAYGVGPFSFVSFVLGVVSPILFAVGVALLFAAIAKGWSAKVASAGASGQPFAGAAQQGPYATQAPATQAQATQAPATQAPGGPQQWAPQGGQSGAQPPPAPKQQMQGNARTATPDSPASGQPPHGQQSSQRSPDGPQAPQF